MCVCVSVALVIQHAIRMRDIILSSVACLVQPYFPALSQKRHNFLGWGGRGELLNIKCLFWFSLQILSELLNSAWEVEPPNRPGRAQRVPGALGSQISMIFVRHMKVVRSASRIGPLYPQECSCYAFSLGAESTPGSWYGRKEFVTENCSDTTGNRSRDRPTSSAAP